MCSVRSRNLVARKKIIFGELRSREELAEVMVARVEQSYCHGFGRRKKNISLYMLE